MMFSIGEREHWRKMTLMFLMVHCRSSFKCILRRTFLAKLDAIASTIHLKVYYLDEEGKAIAIGADLHDERRIGRIIQDKKAAMD